MPSESIAIKVAAKCRPFSQEERSKGCKGIVKTSGNSIIVNAGGKEQSFSFDHCYPAEVKASQIYKDCCDGLLQKAFRGMNVSIMSFGSANSGKTYLMSGIEEEPGIIPCLNRGIFKYIEEAKGRKDFFLTVSFLEVQDDKLTDMLNPHPNEMKIREHPQLGIYVDGLSEIVAHTEDDLCKLYEQGNRARMMGTSDIRAHRARSTGIFTIRMDQKETNSSKVGLRSTITLVDLAGVEVGRDASGNVVNVLSALKKGGHVPYRDSKVTRLLQDSLGGSAVTLILAMVSLADQSYTDTVATLQHAQAARNIKNQVKMNVDETNNIISDLREEIARLRNKLAKNPDNSNKEDVLKLEDLVQDLQVAKQQMWEEKQSRSSKFEEERKTNLANKGILEWVMDSMRKGNKEVQERIVILQKEKDQLTLEYRDKRKRVDDMKESLQKKIADYSRLAESGRANESETKQQVSTIHEMKEKLKRETDALKDIKHRLKDVQDRQRAEKEAAQGQTLIKGNAELRQLVEAEDRRRQETENKALVAEELERMKLETEHEKADIQMRVSQGKKYTPQEGSKLETELVDLRAERAVVTLQLQGLQQEKERLAKDLEEVYKRHKEDLEIQQLQHFQTFRQYREMFEQQKAVLEQRYRGLLEDAVQDAVFLSTRNNELEQENLNLKQQVAEYKDKMSRS